MRPGSGVVAQLGWGLGGAGAWGLVRARETAESIAGSPGALRALVRILFGDDPELRRRAADVARRITDQDPLPLVPFSEQLAGLLAELPPGEARTRWHLALVVPRVARTHEQRLRAARIMTLLAADESNAVRCSAMEGLAALAIHAPELRERADDLAEEFLRRGTPAMKSRARSAQRALTRRYGSQ